MIQIVETTDVEKFEMYNKLDKSVLIGMLIECNKHISRIIPKVELNKCFYTAGDDTSGRCIHCGKQKFEH